MFDRPLQTGFSFYSRRYNFNESQQASVFAGQDLGPLFDLLGSQNIQNYRQSSVGFTTFASYPLRNNFTRLGLTYGYDISNITTFSTVSQLYFENLNFNGLAGPDSLEGISTSKVVPTYNYSTVDSQLSPTRGTGLFASLELTGLGGNVRMYRPTVDFRWFRGFTGGGRIFGMHLRASTMSGYGGRVLPPFIRSFIGGETDIRGFDINTISPIGFLPDTLLIPVLNANGTLRSTTGPDAIGLEGLTAQTMVIPVNRITFPGGDTNFVGNFEYRIPLFGPVTFALFADVGINMAWRRDELQLTDRRLTELTTAFPSTDFTKRIELAVGTNQQWRASVGGEVKVLMPILNVPFRVYWAYNPLRLSTTIHPVSLVERAMFPNQATFQSAVDAYGTPRSYSEPQRSFRFTIGTTF
jgi:outer membrane protein insertion porin family